MMDSDAVWAVAGPHVIKYIRGKEVGLTLKIIISRSEILQGRMPHESSRNITILCRMLWITNISTDRRWRKDAHLGSLAKWLVNTWIIPVHISVVQFSLAGCFGV
jgi:hypothetical protein